ncbi:MarR family winged helix-turn-helix transcriptional regulator [Maritalea porphyrae]|jgi:DNA-binding MarR family transcriptional regulator|uniref:MarR family winged helix-turn-helix transcriptional regulator n=1 Tax=Maritalea porphyrae TaxID=880732 RepID=UPI0022AF8A90|nr:MarR family winged helix-turn-helix transcriptional regulator [Maritalea porphyrae]MCZ4271610.1 MarR family winged helix-turn-helix transcriptional regulator [Maritalea porphyrae]
MDEKPNIAFAQAFELLYRDFYALAMRRVRDKRQRLSPSSVGFLNHLAITGPMTLAELTVHFDRAPSTLSEMVSHMEAKGLVEKQKDPSDGRRSMIWLTQTGQTALREAQTVLDIDQLALASARLEPQDQETLLKLLNVFRNELSNKPNEED